MEIVYIWFESYNNLNSLNLNFGSNKIFEYNNKRRVVTVNPNLKYVKNFFHSELFPEKEVRLKNVTAIVGENGTGKSSVLDFVRFYKEEFMKQEMIIIYRINDDTFEYESNVAELIIEDDESIKYSKINQKRNMFHTIFFSNVLDPRIYMKIDNRKNVNLDLSTNYLIKESTDSLNFFNEELIQQINFWMKYRNNREIKEFLNVPLSINMKLPDFRIMINNYNERPRSVYTKFTKVEFFHLFIEHGFKNIKEENQISIMKEEEFYYSLYKNSIIYWFTEVHSFMQEEELSGNLYRDIYGTLTSISKNIIERDLNSNRGTIDIFHILSEVIYDVLESRISEKGKEKLKKITIQNALVLKEIFKKVEILDLNIINNSMAEVVLNSSVIKIIEVQNKLENGNRIMSIFWMKMSSGEYAFLNIFSRLELGRKRIKNNKTSSLVLLIDEGELYFHPQWQKNWLEYLLKGVNIIFENDMKIKSIQVVLTTHSPLVLSDFPNDRVVFLRKEAKGVTATSVLNDGQQTFAANIHNLFSNSFFIQDGLIGLFAKDKINNLINFLISSTPEQIKENEDVIKNIIDFIGEPILKNKLIEIYSAKNRLINQNEIEKQIEILKSRIKKLEEKRVGLND